MRLNWRLNCLQACQYEQFHKIQASWTYLQTPSRKRLSASILLSAPVDPKNPILLSAPVDPKHSILLSAPVDPNSAGPQSKLILPG